jgi:hypothetical protein
LGQWLHFLLVAMHAAEIPRLFLFIDQTPRRALVAVLPQRSPPIL